MPIAFRSQLPAVSPDATFVAWHEVRGRPHVVVDGPSGPQTVLGLSHWPDGGTPAELEADTSTEIVARYLAAEAAGDPVDVITNNHFDEDGILAAYLLVARPDLAVRQRAIAAAEAGDFRTWTDPAAAWVAIAVMAMAERPTTPFPDVLRALNNANTHDPAGAVTCALLPHIGKVLDDPERYRRLWEPTWRRIAAEVALLDAGDATIEEFPGHDLAIVRSPHPLAPLAVLPRVEAMRVVTATADGILALEHRYETWVRYVSRTLPPRVDVSSAIDTLNAMSPAAGRWRFEGIAHPQARLTFGDASGQPIPSGLSVEAFCEVIVARNPPANR